MAERPPRTPFVATTGQFPAIADRSRFERALEGAYRWRTILGLSLATLMTVAIVAVYRSPAGPGSDLTSVAGPSTSDVRSAIEAVTDFDAAATGDPATTVPGQRQVGSEVDDSPSTASQDQATPTATRPPATAGDETSSSATTVPEATTTVLNEAGTSEQDGTSSSSDGSPTSSTTASDSSVPTTADPSSTTTGPAPVQLEAESGLLLGLASVQLNHLGFSGVGYIGDLILEGSGVTLTLDDHPGGPTALAVRYAAGNTVVRGEGPRTLSLVVNGTRVTQLSMERNGNWTEWWTLDAGEIDLEPGTNEISLIWMAGDTGWVNLDYVQLG
jgi:hypothetical protein